MHKSQRDGVKQKQDRFMCVYRYTDTNTHKHTYTLESKHKCNIEGSGRKETTIPIKY